jgi:hypothetical protein
VLPAVPPPPRSAAGAPPPRRRITPDSGTERALAALPLGEYANVGEVLRSVPADPAPGRTEAERVSSHRQHRKPHLGEHMRDHGLPPVEEELRGD